MSNNPFSIEKAIGIRQPSTANLMISSIDRVLFGDTPWNFSIIKPNSIFNGFFTRIGATEVVLDWAIPNISNDISNNYLSILDTSGNITHPITLPDGFYTVEEALDTIVNLANAAFGGTNFSIVVDGGQVQLRHAGSTVGISNTNLSRMLSLYQGAVFKTVFPIFSPDLRFWKYLDFISPQLTYNQDLKDASTNEQVRDVLCRWYMTWDNPVNNDGYGFPILMGYTPFTCRRLFSPPKQIKWDNTQPVGQISFEVYGYASGLTLNLALTSGVLLSQIYQGIENYNTDWYMTLQVSEV